jgi:hypothetical protein
MKEINTMSRTLATAVRASAPKMQTISPARMAGNCVHCGTYAPAGEDTIQYRQGLGAWKVQHRVCTEPVQAEPIRFGRGLAPCPTCKGPMPFAYVAKRYQCDHCADIAEGRAWGPG